MSQEYYNNLGIGAIALGSVLTIREKLPVSKVFLIYPLISHKELLSYLSRKTTNVIGIDKLIVDKTSCFSNFNKRYYESLPITTNAIQLLNDVGTARFVDGNIVLRETLEYRDEMGERARKIFLASQNISLLMSESKETLYTSLRVEI